MCHANPVADPTFGRGRNARRNRLRRSGLRPADFRPRSLEAEAVPAVDFSAMAYLCMNSPLGPLTLFGEEGFLVAVEWGQGRDPQSSPLLAEARDQLDAYFDGRLKAFDLPLKPAGTPFQLSLWARLPEIPYGATTTYGALARVLNTAPRAVGGACGRNPLPIVVPCHRVIGAGGRMTGFSGIGGIAAKETLLRLEGG